jgi:hypothetical protein
MLDAASDRPLPLRVAHQPPGESGAAAAACAALLTDADQPLWGLDAVLAAALPDGEDSLPGRVLEILQGCLRGPAPETDDVHVLLKELLAAVHREAGPNAAALSIVVLREDRYFAAAHAEAPAFLLRQDLLLPLAHHAPDGAVDFRSGAVKDGDAFLLFTQSPGGCGREEEVRTILGESHLPANACRRLAALRSGLGVALLYAGIGPVLAARLRSGWQAPPAAVSPLPAAPPASRRLTPVAMVGLAALGVLLGTGVGVLLALGRSPAPPVSPPVPSPILAPAAAGQVPEAAPAPRERVQAVRQVTSQYAPPAPAPRTPAPASNADVPPPPHLLASGMSAQVALQVGMDARHEELVLSVNQGTLYSSTQPQGIPSGEPLLLPLHPSVRARLQQPDAAVQLVTENGRIAASVGSRQIRQMLDGQAVAVPNLMPGTYRLAYTGGQETEQAQAFAAIRIAGIAGN